MTKDEATKRPDLTVEELEKYAINAWVLTDGDSNGKQVLMPVVQLNIAKSVVERLVLEGQKRELAQVLATASGGGSWRRNIINRIAALNRQIEGLEKQ